MLIFVSTYIDCSNMEKKLILDLQKNQRKNGLLRNSLFFNIMRVGQPEKVTGQ